MLTDSKLISLTVESFLKHVYQNFVNPKAFSLLALNEFARTKMYYQVRIFAFVISY